MENNDQNPDVTQEQQGNEVVEETTKEESTTSQEDLDYWKGEAMKYKRIAERKDKQPEPEEKPQKNIKSTSDELDYGQLAFLTAKGVEDGETEFVQQELRKFGGELKDLWNNEYFQSRLKSHRDTMAAKEATPSSKRATGEAPSSKADYWIARNEMPANTPENQELRREIVNKRMERERNANKFAGQSIISN